MPQNKKSLDARRARHVAQVMHDQDTYTDLLGISLDEVRLGYARVSATVRADMLNMYAGCHGGFIFTIADSAFGYACNSRNKSSLAQFASINFLSSAKEGDVLVGEAIERSIVGKTGIFDVTVTANKNALIAEFRGVSRRIEGQVTQLPDELV